VEAVRGRSGVGEPGSQRDQRAVFIAVVTVRIQLSKHADSFRRELSRGPVRYVGRQRPPEVGDGPALDDLRRSGGHPGEILLDVRGGPLVRVGGAGLVVEDADTRSTVAVSTR